MLLYYPLSTNALVVNCASASDRSLPRAYSRLCGRSLLGDDADWLVPELPFTGPAQVAFATDPGILESEVFRFPRASLTYVSAVGDAWFGPILRAEADGIVPGVRRSIVLVCQLRETATLQETAAFLAHAQVFR